MAFDSQINMGILNIDIKRNLDHEGIIAVFSIHVRRKFSFRYPIPMLIQSNVALQRQQNVEMFAQTCHL